MTPNGLRALGLILAIVAIGGPVRAQTAQVTHTQKAESSIASIVTAPPGTTTYYVSGMTGSVIDPSAPKGSLASYGDTKAQTVSALTRIRNALADQKLGLADVVMMHVYLVGDPSKDGKMDFAGMMEGYLQFFGTPDQPNKPARSTVQVASLVAPGTLVEIEVIAVK